MEIGITGAGGFVGSALVEAAVGAGHGVVGFSRRPSGGERLLDPSGGRVADLSGLDALVHLAGEPILGLWTAGKRRRIRESRVGLTGRLAAALGEALGEGGPGVFVSCSGVGFYGDRGDDLLAEGEPSGAGFLAELARDWEGAAAGAEAAGVRVCYARPGMVLGAGGGALPLMARGFRLGLGGRLGSGRQWLPWVHVRDAAAALLEMVENPAMRGPVNVVAPGQVTNAEFTRALAGVLRRPAVLPVPSLALKLGLGGLSELLLASQRAVPGVLGAEGFDFRFPELGGALADLLGRG